ncbi:MAG: FliI/YscN family ATPase [Phycisphaerales bacterium]|nr:FliI/YscN family ATPase [Phycisphaerales bacterium]
MRPLEQAIARVGSADALCIRGRIRALRGLTLLAEDKPAVVGSLVQIRCATGPKLAEVVGFEAGNAILMLLEQSGGVRAGDIVESVQSQPTIEVGDGLLGRVVNGLGMPIDGGPPIESAAPHPLHAVPISAMRRPPINMPIATGVASVDLLAPVGCGQRVGIFAGPGVGKSTLLGMIARGAGAHVQHADGAQGADVNVIVLIGERGREVREFVEGALGEAGMARSVVVVATSDESPVMRVRAAHAACAIAEGFRDQGKRVVLMLDSVTRFAHAQRQIGLAIGEPPATRGYTPSVFAALPQLLERAGVVESDNGQTEGSITGFYAVLVDGDDLTEPVSDAVRGILDGHLILSRNLAQRGHYPAIDPLDSVSRVGAAVSSKEHDRARRTIVRLLAAYRAVEELIQIGAYTSGADPVTDVAVALKPRIDALLQQEIGERIDHAKAVASMIALAQEAEERLGASGQGKKRSPPTQRRVPGGQAAA